VRTYCDGRSVRFYYAGSVAPCEQGLNARMLLVYDTHDQQLHNVSVKHLAMADGAER